MQGRPQSLMQKWLRIGALLCVCGQVVGWVGPVWADFAIFEVVFARIQHVDLRKVNMRIVIFAKSQHAHADFSACPCWKINMANHVFGNTCWYSACWCFRKVNMAMFIFAELNMFSFSRNQNRPREKVFAVLQKNQHMLIFPEAQELGWFFFFNIEASGYLVACRAAVNTLSGRVAPGVYGGM